nr:uncharacterized protein LOC107970285 [Pan troglodytes]
MISTAGRRALSASAAARSHSGYRCQSSRGQGQRCRVASWGLGRPRVQLMPGPGAPGLPSSVISPAPLSTLEDEFQRQSSIIMKRISQRTHRKADSSSETERAPCLSGWWEAMGFIPTGPRVGVLCPWWVKKSMALGQRQRPGRMGTCRIPQEGQRQCAGGMGCRRDGMQAGWDAGGMGCRRDGMQAGWEHAPSHRRDRGSVGCRQDGMQAGWDAGGMGCRRDGMQAGWERAPSHRRDRGRVQAGCRQDENVPHPTRGTEAACRRDEMQAGWDGAPSHRRDRGRVQAGWDAGRMGRRPIPQEGQRQGAGGMGCRRDGMQAGWDAGGMGYRRDGMQAGWERAPSHRRSSVGLTFSQTSRPRRVQKSEAQEEISPGEAEACPA